AQPEDLILSALYEIGAQSQGESLSSEDAAWGLEKLQRLIDSWNARREMIFSHTFTQYNIKPNHSPHTFGPGGDFDVPIRPVRVISASVILDSGQANPVDLPVNIRDDDWWANNPLK